MANYCNIEQVEVLLGVSNSLTTTSTPTIAQVNDIITDVTSDIDFALKSVGITIQPTDTTILGRLTIACKYGTACQAGMAGFGNNDSVEDSQPNFYCKSYANIIKDIRTNPENYGAVTGDNTLFISNQVLDGTTTETAQNDNSIDPTFEV